jgi:hypothetical protein
MVMMKRPWIHGPTVIDLEHPKRIKMKKPNPIEEPKKPVKKK